MQHLGGVFYINLDRRTDRRREIEGELEGMGLSGERFAGIAATPGIVGCGLSHLAVLRLARDRGLKNVLILEDDFQFVVSKEQFWTRVGDFFERGIPYDVLMLSYSIQASQPIDDLIMRIEEADTASAYIVNACFYDALIELYEEAMPQLAATGKHWIWANDQIWKRLQPTSRWFATTLRLGKQRASYSDNSLQYMDRGV
jgi:glycosyl transferase family 25